MTVNSIRMLFPSFWFVFFAIIFLLPYSARAAPALNGTHSGRGSSPLRWELQKVSFLLNELFYSKSGKTVQCHNNEEIAKAEVISCIVAMVNNSGSALDNASPYDCRFFQAEYDCISAAVRGCAGAESALAQFLSVEQEIGQKYGCRIKVDVTTTEASTLRQVPGGATQGSSKPRGHRRPPSPRKKSNNYVSISASKQRHTDSDDTLNVVSNTASFLFNWLPRSIMLATNFEFDD